jgi:hypothetical protein
MTNLRYTMTNVRFRAAMRGMSMRMVVPIGGVSQG